MTVAMPEITYGDRFQVESRRGSPYVVTLLGVGDDESGLYVRLDDGRIARLDPGRLAWDTYRPTTQEGQPPLRPGDEVLVESTSGTLRGTLLQIDADALLFRLPVGSDLEPPRDQIARLNLLFRARDLKAGDRILVRSNSGNEYRGRVKALGPGRRLQLALQNGSVANLRLGKIDLGSLLILIPVS